MSSSQGTSPGGSADGERGRSLLTPGSRASEPILERSEDGDARSSQANLLGLRSALPSSAPTSPTGDAANTAAWTLSVSQVMLSGEPGASGAEPSRASVSQQQQHQVVVVHLDPSTPSSYPPAPGLGFGPGGGSESSGAVGVVALGAADSGAVAAASHAISERMAGSAPPVTGVQAVAMEVTRIENTSVATPK